MDKLENSPAELQETAQKEKISDTEISAEKSTPKSDAAPAQESTSSTPEVMVSLRHVHISQRKLLVLSDVSFSVKRGELVYLIGKTGSGKSSILKTLIAEVKPQGEEAMMIGYDLLTLKKKKIPELRKKIGVVFQDYQLLSDKTVLENMMFVLRATGWKNRSAMLERSHEVLALVGLTTKDFKLPSQLSGGEQQRVCIARALLNNPDLILADEPTGNLDPITAEEIFQIFSNINQTGTTVIMATHNFPMINKFPSRTICIEEGKLLDSGF